MFSKLNTAVGQARLAARVRNMLGVDEDPNVKVGINGFGRLGRLLAHAIRETDGVDLVAINDPYIDIEYMAYMLQHDGAHGPYRGSVAAEPSEDGTVRLVLDGRPVTVTQAKEPSEINWVESGARYVIEASGYFDSPKKASGHLRSGAYRVVVAAPCGDAPQFVVGLNHLQYRDQQIVSAGSPAAHAAALLARAVDEAAGVKTACLSVLQASKPHELEQIGAGPAGPSSLDWRSGRGGGNDVIPSASDAALAVGVLLPHLKTKVHGAGFRVPASSGVSVVDLTAELSSAIEWDALRRRLREACASAALSGRLGYRDDVVDGADFVDDGRSCVIDGHSSLALSETFVKVIGWYAKEWPYAKRLVELLLHMQAVDHGVMMDGEIQ